MKISRKSSVMAGMDFGQALRKRINELEGGIESSDTIVGIDDVMLEDEDLEYEDGYYDDQEVIDDMYDDEPETMYSNYEEFIDSVNETFEDPLSEETISEDISLIQDAIANAYPDEDIHISECPVFWKDSYEYPYIEVNGQRAAIQYIEDMEGDSPDEMDVTRRIELVWDDQDLCDELGVVDDTIEESCNKVNCSYKIEDTYGAPQAGVDVKEFDTFDEMQEYIDNDPDLMERINEGYARIIED